MAFTLTGKRNIISLFMCHHREHSIFNYDFDINNNN